MATVIVEWPVAVIEESDGRASMLIISAIGHVEQQQISEVGSRVF
ncbi:hypothetical protein AVEN_227840-1, partial [Araneus ventricosus]